MVPSGTRDEDSKSWREIVISGKEALSRKIGQEVEPKAW
jgi:hypothetical protein